MERRLEDRIRRLCEQAITLHQTEGFYSVIDELKAALREHAARVRTVAEARLLVCLRIEERRDPLGLRKFENAEEAEFVVVPAASISHHVC